MRKLQQIKKARLGVPFNGESPLKQQPLQTLQTQYNIRLRTAPALFGRRRPVFGLQQQSFFKLGRSWRLLRKGEREPVPGSGGIR